jgi:hypothetical protein
VEVRHRGRWYNIVNTHAPTEDKSDDTKDEELDHVFDQFPKYDIGRAVAQAVSSQILAAEDRIRAQV